MNKTEVLKIMSILRGAYPQFYRDVSREEAASTVGLWEDMFKNDDYQIVAAAVKALIESDEKGYPPHIGAVKAKIRLLTGKEEMSEAEAWGIVARALKNSLYGAKEEFEKFPPIIRRIVGSPNQLREWGMMDSETVHSVVASNFQRAYRTISKREQELSKISPDVRNIIGAMEERMEIGE